MLGSRNPVGLHFVALPFQHADSGCATAGKEEEWRTHDCKCFRPEGTHMTSANSLLARNNHIGNKLISKGAVKFRGTHGIIIMTSAKFLNFCVNLMI